MKAALMGQLKHEMDSSYLYLSMASWFSYSNYDGMCHWMRCQASEEWDHAMKIFDHMIDRDCRVMLPQIGPVKNDWESSLHIWEEAYIHEQKITANIHSVMDVAMAVKDYSVKPMLLWFLEEQIEEEKKALKILDHVRTIKGDPNTMMFLDKELKHRAIGHVYYKDRSEQND